MKSTRRIGWVFLLLVAAFAWTCVHAQTIQGLGGRGGSEPIQVRGFIVPIDPDAELPPEIALPDTDARKRIVGTLVVEADLPRQSHVYSVFQPDVPGGMPTKITVAVPPDAPYAFTPFFDASTVATVDFLDDKLYELEGEAVWIAPIFSKEGIDSLSDAAVAGLATLEVAGDFDALVCDDDNCRPYQQKITFVYNPDYDLSEPLEVCAQTLLFEKQAHLFESLKSAVPDLPIFQKTESPVPAAASTSDAASLAAESRAGSFGRNIFYDLLIAFLGGMILNVMPCVLPVIGLKIIGFFEQAGQSRSRALTLNCWYALGILSVFAVLAMMSVGLSYLFTYGLFQIVMGGIVFVMALNLMGVWEIELPAFLGGKKSNDLMRREGAFGAVFKGVITTLLAIPCGAPLLSPALVWTDAMIQQGRSGMALLVYLVIGLGMATPYLFLGAFPELLRFLPKPGLWMETFRNIMGFVLLPAVVWILFSMPLALVLPTVALLFALWFACWYLGKTPFDASGTTRWRRRLLAFSVVLATLFFSYNIPLSGGDESDSAAPRRLNEYTLENAVTGKLRRWAVRAERAGELAGQEGWTLFSREKLNADLAAGRPVLVDFTADWCMNCKVLESAVLKSDRIERLIREKNIVTLTADWTSRDKTPDGREVGEMLRRYGGEQVPVVFLFSPKDPESPTILRGLFSVETLAEAIETLDYTDST